MVPRRKVPGASKKIFSTDAGSRVPVVAFAANCRHKQPSNGWRLNRKEMTMLKKLMLILILGMIMSGPAAPILKSFLGIGSTTAYAQNDDDQGEDNDDQGENEQ
jgi:hypothetical protein